MWRLQNDMTSQSKLAHQAKSRPTRRASFTDITLEVRTKSGSTTSFAMLR